MLPCGCVTLLVLFSGWRNLVLSVPGYQATSYRSSAMSGVTCTFEGCPDSRTVDVIFHPTSLAAEDAALFAYLTHGRR